MEERQHEGRRRLLLCPPRRAGRCAKFPQSKFKIAIGTAAAGFAPEHQLCDPNRLRVRSRPTPRRPRAALKGGLKNFRLVKQDNFQTGGQTAGHPNDRGERAGRQGAPPDPSTSSASGNHQDRRPPAARWPTEATNWTTVFEASNERPFPASMSNGPVAKSLPPAG